MEGKRWHCRTVHAFKVELIAKMVLACMVRLAGADAAKLNKIMPERISFSKTLTEFKCFLRKIFDISQSESLQKLYSKLIKRVKNCRLQSKSGQANRVVFFIHDPALYESTNLMDNLYFLAKNDNIAVSIEMKDNEFKTVEKISSVLKSILENEQWQDIPVYVLGSGGGGRLAAVAALDNGELLRRILFMSGHLKICPFPRIAIRVEHR